MFWDWLLMYAFVLCSRLPVQFTVAIAADGLSVRNQLFLSHSCPLCSSSRLLDSFLQQYLLRDSYSICRSNSLIIKDWQVCVEGVSVIAKFLLWGALNFNLWSFPLVRFVEDLVIGLHYSQPSEKPRSVRRMHSHQLDCLSQGFVVLRILKSSSWLECTYNCVYLTNQHLFIGETEALLGVGCLWILRNKVVAFSSSPHKVHWAHSAWQWGNIPVVLNKLVILIVALPSSLQCDSASYCEWR